MKRSAGAAVNVDVTPAATFGNDDGASAKCCDSSCSSSEVHMAADLLISGVS